MPLKIAILNYSSSGLFHYASCLANALSKRNDSEILFITSRHNNLGLIEQRQNLRVFSQDAPHNLPGFFLWLANIQEQVRLYRAVTDFSPDLLHITDSHAIYVPHQWWLKRYPILVTQHDPHVRQGDVYPIASRIIHRTQQRLAKQIVVHGDSIKRILSKQGVAGRKIHVIPHGAYSFYTRWRDTSIGPIPNSVLFFGRVVDYKGLDILLQSIIHLQREKIPISLILAGAGSLTKYEALLRQVKHKTIDNRSIPDQEVIRYFQMSTLLALPYREASQSGIIAIAMPAGVPIVATRVGALPEILKDGVNSLLVNPNDTAALAGAIKKLLQSEELRQQLVHGAKETVKRHLLWEHIAGQYHQIYRSLI